MTHTCFVTFPAFLCFQAIINNIKKTHKWLTEFNCCLRFASLHMITYCVEVRTFFFNLLEFSLKSFYLHILFFYALIQKK